MVAGSDQMFQHVFKHGKTVRRFRQVLGMEAEVKDPSMSPCGGHSATESLDARAQSDDPSPPRSNRVEEQGRWYVPKARQSLLRPNWQRSATAQFIEKPRQLTGKGGPELEGPRHGASAVAVDTMSRQQVMMCLLFAPERE
jgi:hypothetical protein